MFRVGFLGFGNMARAIAGGMLARGFLGGGETAAYDPAPEAYSAFEGGVTRCDSAAELAANTEYLFICVKPQVISEALSEIRGALGGKTVLISIAAGVETKRISELTGGRCAVVRAMPNAPMQAAMGVTAIARPEGIGDGQYLYILEAFRCVGTVYEISPDGFNEIIPVHASSPAFVGLMAKLIAEEAEKSGIDFEKAVSMFCDTLSGSAEMLRRPGMTPDGLIDMVSSKGGTTAAALSAMLGAGFAESVRAGFRSCVRRAYELGVDKS